MTVGPWHVGLAGMSIIGVSFGFARYGYGLFVPVFEDEFGLSTETLGLVSGGSYASYLLALLAGGVLAARFGPRLPVVLAGACATVGMTLIALAPHAGVMATGALLASTSPGWAWAPLSDAVSQLVRPRSRDRVLSVVSTGTAVGLAVAGPVALVAGGSWRLAWIVFAALALGSMLWNARLLPTQPYRRTATRRRAGGPGWRWFVNGDSWPLLAVALLFGVSSAFYWTYAADLALDRGLPESTRSVLWACVGVVGVVGLVTGDLVRRFGLRRILLLALALLAGAIGLLGLFPGTWSGVVASGALYGPGFMMMSALLAVWSGHVFPERPSAGFSATLLALAVGSIIGPAALGLLAGSTDMAVQFLVAAAVTVVGMACAVPATRRTASM
ncbi:MULTISPECIES: MFS transporter [unclassified Isoptericola]|uniref:MFS transporter n=1 Tax=unclassified Isoptericola TaxID=2623355 RepID=UPI002713D9FB|nr:MULTISPECIES: MFS transporter [unclassified Isoptericola]MDO8145670.1 MFS transporter [Isoptericola sp. 178]MDO8152088.1 MFS transporter [Isoptericola sp. b408]